MIIVLRSKVTAAYIGLACVPLLVDLLSHTFSFSDFDVSESDSVSCYYCLSFSHSHSLSISVSFSVSRSQSRSHSRITISWYRVLYRSLVLYRFLLPNRTRILYRFLIYTAFSFWIVLALALICFAQRFSPVSMFVLFAACDTMPRTSHSREQCAGRSYAKKKSRPLQSSHSWSPTNIKRGTSHYIDSAIGTYILLTTNDMQPTFLPNTLLAECQPQLESHFH